MTVERPQPDLSGDGIDAPARAVAGLFLSAEPPLAIAEGTDEIRVLHGAGLRAVIAERLAQISRRGFSLETDMSRGPAYLAQQARIRMGAAIEQLAVADDASNAAARNNIVRAAALAIAALDSFPIQIGAVSAPVAAGLPPPEGDRAGGASSPGGASC